MSPAQAAAPALGSASAGSCVVTEAGRAKPFDIRRQETIERARLRRLQPMLETVAHRIGGSLTQALRQSVRVELTATDQAVWEDYAASLPEPTFLSSAVLLPLEGRVVLHFPVPLTLRAIDFYLGGDGLNQPERDQLSETERTLVAGLFQDLWTEIPQPFGTFSTISPAMVATSTSALLIQIGRPGILCLVCRLQVTIADGEATEIQLCLPGTVVLALLEQLERHQSDGALGSGMDRHETRRRLMTVGLEMRLAYPPIGLTPAELLGLRVGDVIPIGRLDPDQPQVYRLAVGEVPFGTGLLVESGTKLACTILTKREERS